MVLNDRGKLFLSKRSQNCKNERGHWETPGGSVEFGETLEQAVKREMLEEYGTDIEPKIMEPDKCDEIGWFALDKLPQPLSIITKADLEEYGNRKQSTKSKETTLLRGGPLNVL